MSWFIDTNIAIHFRDGDEAIFHRLDALDGDVMLSIVSRVELQGGVHQVSSQSVARRMRLDRMLMTLPVVDFDGKSADAYRTIIEAVGFSRRKVLDRMIAAQAIANRAFLITLNGDDFRDIPGLDLVEW